MSRRKSCRGVCAKRLTAEFDPRAFSIVELLVVITIIIVLAGLILMTSGYVQKKGARSRAEAEIAAMSAALESYKADKGAYPTDPSTETLSANAGINWPGYQTASKFLYVELSGDPDLAGGLDPDMHSYMQFKPGAMGRRDMSQPVSASNKIDYLRDPFGNSYGYSTIKFKNPTGTAGYNPTFDLWSTGGATTDHDQSQWIKNW